MQAEYGADGRLASRTAGGATTTYGYDGLGRAVSTSTTESTGTVTATWTFDGLDPVGARTSDGAEVALVRDTLGTVALQADDRLSGTTDGAVRWGLVDALGSLVAQASAASGAASITQLATYDDYGTADQQTPGWASVTGYSGQMADLATGVRYHQRMYDPLSGTWTSPDAWRGLLAAPLTLNRFAFVLGDPVSMVDLLGFAGHPLIDGAWGSPGAARVHYTAKIRAHYAAKAWLNSLLGGLRGPADPMGARHQYSANGPLGRGTATRPAVPLRPEARRPHAEETERHAAIEGGVSACALICLSSSFGNEFDVGPYVNVAIGVGPAVGLSVAGGYRSDPDPGWGTDLVCAASIGPIGIEASTSYLDPFGSGSGLMFSPGAEFGCAVMTGYTHQW
jgi:RHS repeat-associated protein